MTTTTESPINAAERLAPAPTSREGANRVTWIKHYAAQALAAYATFRTEIRTVPRNPEPGSRPDLGYLMLAATSSTTATAALVDQAAAPKLIWDLTPEAGALNGEWEEWLADVLVGYGVNPGHIDPDLDPADFAEAVRTRGPSNEPFVCRSCQETAYRHTPDCIAQAGRTTTMPQTFRKKPVEIQAVQWTGDNTSDVIDWVLSSGSRSARWHETVGLDEAAEARRPKREHIAIDTLEGTMRAFVGDWIIREPFSTLDRHFYPCKPDIFEATYDRVTAP